MNRSGEEAVRDEWSGPSVDTSILADEVKSQQNTGEKSSREAEASRIGLDDLLTPAQFARWVGESESWVRRRLASLPGVIREGRKHIRIHPRTYLEKRLRGGLAEGGRRR